MDNFAATLREPTSTTTKYFQGYYSLPLRFVFIKSLSVTLCYVDMNEEDIGTTCASDNEGQLEVKSVITGRMRNMKILRHLY